jgi:hypothetical protein
VPNTDGVEIDVVVSQAEYERCKPDQHVLLRVYHGRLGVRWFEVGRTCVDTNSLPR